MRIVVHAPRRIRDADLSEVMECYGGRLCARDVVVQQYRFPELSTNRLNRVERRHRVLKNHRHLVATNLSQPRFGSSQEVLPFEDHGAGRLRVASLIQSHDRQARDALARSGLTDDSQRLTCPDAKADVVDGAYDSVAGDEVRCESLDLEERRSCREGRRFHPTPRALVRSASVCVYPRRTRGSTSG